MRWFILSLSDALNKLARYAVIAALCIMFLTVMVQVLARYVFSSPPIWTEDIARYMMVWTGLLGATISFKTRTDAVLLGSVFPERPSLFGWFAETVQSVAVLTFTLPVLYFCFVGLRGGFAKGYLARQAGLTADTLGVQMVWIVSVVPLAMVVILVHLAARWANPTGASTSAETEIL